MRYIIKNATVLTENGFEKIDLFIDNGIVVSVGGGDFSEAEVFDFNNCFIFPGFADVHVHLREPGFSYKETIRTGTEACARGGYTDVCSMPNLNPVPDSVENLKIQTDIIEKDAVIEKPTDECQTNADCAEKYNNNNKYACITRSDTVKECKQATCSGEFYCRGNLSLPPEEADAFCAVFDKRLITKEEYMYLDYQTYSDYWINDNGIVKYGYK